MTLADYLDETGTRALEAYGDRIDEHLLLILKLMATNAPRLDIMDARNEFFQELEDWLADDAAARPTPDDDDYLFRAIQEGLDERLRRVEGHNGG